MRLRLENNQEKNISRQDQAYSSAVEKRGEGKEKIKERKEGRKMEANKVRGKKGGRNKGSKEGAGEIAQ